MNIFWILVLFDRNLSFFMKILKGFSCLVQKIFAFVESFCKVRALNRQKMYICQERWHGFQNQKYDQNIWLKQINFCLLELYNKFSWGAIFFILQQRCHDLKWHSKKYLINLEKKISNEWKDEKKVCYFLRSKNFNLSLKSFANTLEWFTT